MAGYVKPDTQVCAGWKGREPGFVAKEAQWCDNCKYANIFRGAACGKRGYRIPDAWLKAMLIQADVHLPQRLKD